MRPHESVRSPALRAGDRVAVVSPAGPPDAGRVAAGVALLRSWGLRPVVAPHAHDAAGYLAGTDAARAADLTDAFADPTVRAVLTTRGGYGCQRVVDLVDPAPLRRDPKPVVGFSDVTALQLALWRGARLACLHGPGVAWRPERTGPGSADSLRRALMTTAPVELKPDPVEATAPVTRAGTATGTLLGGNLCLLAASLGTSDFPDLAGVILLLEDVGEPPYKVDRMLTQLRRSGAFDRLAGIAVGQFTRCGDERGTEVAEVLAERLLDLPLPVLGGLPVGHGAGQLTVPVGVPATLDADGGLLTTEAAVR